MDFWLLDKGELADAGTALLHDGNQPFVWGTYSSVPHFSHRPGLCIEFKETGTKD